MEKSMTEFSEWVRDRRKASGLLQSELADAVGISHVYISMIERGARVPSNKVRANLEVFLNREGNTPMPKVNKVHKSKLCSSCSNPLTPKVKTMIKLSELPINTLIEVTDVEVDGVEYIWWIKDDDLFWTPIYASSMGVQDAAQISNDEVDWTITKYVIRSIPVGYSLPEAPTEFIEKRAGLAAYLLFMATGMYWADAEGVDNFHSNYTKDADDILRQHTHLLGLETREIMNLDGDN
jgi:transcriptional regulator with XRE-family HTH domain